MKNPDKYSQNQLNAERLVEITDPHFIIDLMYARKENMSGQNVYQRIGFGNQAIVHQDVYAHMLELIPELEAKGYKMRIGDAYRPPLAHIELVRIVPIPGFFRADYTTSNHCHATAIDVCLTDSQGNNLAYPTEMDAYTPEIAQAASQGNFTLLKENLVKARHDYMGATPEQMANRDYLRNLMERHGFLSIPHEWWHYNLVGFENYPVVEL